ncbi:MAG: hypothetical protein MUD06_08960, partial [Rhodospirillales bacterium]|nr:hypothetical protein [Rhodospirillales bacterium]
MPSGRSGSRCAIHRAAAANSGASAAETCSARILARSGTSTSKPARAMVLANATSLRSSLPVGATPGTRIIPARAPSAGRYKSAAMAPPGTGTVTSRRWGAPVASLSALGPSPAA